jgi:hypothetical protein
MVYRLVFLDDGRPDETIRLTDPKVGDVLKIPMYTSEFEELEYWIIVDVNNETVKVNK